MNFAENRRSEIVIFLLGFLILLPLIIVSVYNRPCADDYAYGLLTHQAVKNGENFFQIIKAAWDTDVLFYNSWQGLYSSAFLLALQPGIWGEQYYALTTIILMVIAYACLLGSLHIINKYFLGHSFLFTLSASMVILTILMLWLPSPNEGLYWYNGAMNYLPWVFADLLNVCLMIEIWYMGKERKGKVILLLSTILSFLISGGNHVTSFANILVLLAITAILLMKRRYYSLVSLVSACVGFTIMYVAPGTAIRQNVFNKQSVVNTILTTLMHVRRVGGSSWISMGWILSLAIITPVAIEIAVKNKGIFSKRILLGTVITSFAIICGMFCVPYKAGGTFGGGRLTNIVWIAFMFFSWVIYSMIWGCLVSDDYVNVEKMFRITQTRWKTVFISVCMVALFIVNLGGVDSSSVIAIRELRNGTVYDYAQEMDERYVLYNDDTLSEVAVAPLKTTSTLLFFSDIGTDPSKYPNNQLSDYYNKDIYLDSSEGQ